MKLDRLTRALREAGSEDVGGDFACGGGEESR